MTVFRDFFWKRRIARLGLALSLMLLPLTTLAQTVFVCDEADLVAAIDEAPEDATITFDCDGEIVLTNAIVITKSVTIDGTGHFITLTRPTGTNDTNAVRFFTVMPEATLTLIHLNLFNGLSTNGGAIYVSAGATLDVTSCIFSNNVAMGSNGVNAANISTNNLPRTGKDGRNGTAGQTASGGAIYNLGTATFLECVFLTNSAAGGHGGNGGNGGGGLVLPGKGGSAGRAGAGYGGAIFNGGDLTVQYCSFNNNIAVGGVGGLGGIAGSQPEAGENGNGTAGGGAAGAAILNLRDATAAITSSTFVLNGIAGGDSGDAGDGRRTASRGPNGPNASGGGVANFGIMDLENCTFFGNVAFGGNAGDGGDGRILGGKGGNGGAAWGGNLFNGGKRSSLTVTHCSFSDGGATGGTNGFGGTQPEQAKNGSLGLSRGGNIANSNGTFLLTYSVIAYPSAGTNAYGNFKNANYNLLSDRSIKFNHRAFVNYTNIDPLMDIPRKNGGLVETMELLTNSPAIDKGDGSPLEFDARDIPRDDAPDLGAYEAGLILGPPRIVRQPVDRSVLEGGSVTLSVVATGDAPLLYQWKLGDDDVPGGDSSSLTIDGAGEEHEGEYTVVVGNNSGAVVSQAANLNVLFPPTIVEEVPSGTADSGASFTLSVSVSGDEPFQYQWFKDDVLIPGAVLSTFTVVNATTNRDIGTYSVRVCNLYGCATSEGEVGVSNTPPRIVSISPTNDVVAKGANFEFTVEASGSRPASYFLSFNSPGNVILSNLNTRADLLAFRLNNVTITNQGIYYVTVTNLFGTNVSGPLGLIVQTDPPVITLQPTGVTTIAGQSFQLGVGASGSEPLTYRWFFNSNLLANATEPLLVVTNAQSTNAGFYHVLVSNLVGRATSVVAQVTVQTTGPSFITQPANVVVQAGQNATFTASVNGSALTYQWFFNGTTPVGGNSPTLTINNVQPANNGSYHLRATNLLGTANSSPATLTVNTNNQASIPIPPASTNVFSGNDFTLSATGAGAPPLFYQWYFAAAPVAGGTNNSLTITNAQAGSAGGYRVVVTNSLNAATSAIATVTVTDSAPVITTAHSDVETDIGSNVQFNVAVAGSKPLSFRWYLLTVDPSLEITGTNALASTTANLSLSNVQGTNEGLYRVIVTNAFGTYSSEVYGDAFLNVRGAGIFP